MKKSVYLSLLLLTGAAFQAQAVPAIPTPFSIGQPDGTTVTVTLSGMYADGADRVRKGSASGPAGEAQALARELAMKLKEDASCPEK